MIGITPQRRRLDTTIVRYLTPEVNCSEALHPSVSYATLLQILSPVILAHDCYLRDVVDFMVYARGSSEDFDRYAAVTGDHGWSWNNILPYAFKVGRVNLWNVSHLKFVSEREACRSR